MESPRWKLGNSSCLLGPRSSLQIRKLVFRIRSDEAPSNGDFPMQCCKLVVPIGPAGRSANCAPVGSAEYPPKCAISLEISKLAFPMKSAEPPTDVVMLKKTGKFVIPMRPAGPLLIIPFRPKTADESAQVGPQGPVPVKSSHSDRVSLSTHSNWARGAPSLTQPCR